MPSGHMSQAEREAFLAAVHVAVLSIDEPGRGPLALPVWYRYVDGVVEIQIDGDSLKARLLRAAGRATVTVQTETAPYAYVSVQGPVELVEHPGVDAAMAERYLGAELGRQYVETSGSVGGEVLVRLTPESWRTFDYAKFRS